MTDLTGHIKYGDLTTFANALASDRHGQSELDEGLLYASSLDRTAHVNLLLDHGADVSFKDTETGWSVVHIAVENSASQVLRTLAGRGADLEVRDKSGATPLHLAVDVATDALEQTDAPLDTSVVELLLELGASRDALDYEGRTPGDWASDAACKQLEDILRKDR